MGRVMLRAANRVTVNWFSRSFAPLLWRVSYKKILLSAGARRGEYTFRPFSVRSQLNWNKTDIFPEIVPALPICPVIAPRRTLTWDWFRNDWPEKAIMNMQRFHCIRRMAHLTGSPSLKQRHIPHAIHSDSTKSDENKSKNLRQIYCVSFAR